MGISTTALRAIRRFTQWQRWDRRFWPASDRQSRLTVVSQFFPPDFAATGQLLAQLTQGLASSGTQVQVLSGMPAYAFNQAKAEPVEFEPNRVILRTRASRFWPRRIRGRAVNGVLFCLRTSLRLFKYARRGDLIVYTTEPAYLPLVGWLVHRATSIPFLHTTPYVLLLYDLYPDVLARLGVLSDQHWLMRFWRLLHRFALVNASQIIVLSDAMRRQVLAGVPGLKTPISVIPSWADTDSITPRSKQCNWFVQRYSLGDTFNVLYSGNQGRCHDLVTLVAAATLLRQRAEIRFLFIGAGSQHQRVRELVSDWGLANVMFLPYQEPEVLPYSLSCADLAIVSVGIHAEGLIAPSKVYGHLAAGTPLAVIAPAHSELRTLVGERLGRGFDNGDAAGLADFIRSLVADPEACRAMGQRCREASVSQFSFQSALRAYRQALLPDSQ